MIKRCETCNEISEVFQLPGRKDSNCTRCTADIVMILSLNSALKPHVGRGVAELEGEIGPIVQRLLARFESGFHDPLYSH
jgi:hypothetical protein